MDINTKDYEKFLSAMSSVINIAFNNRELEYFELLLFILSFAYSTESADSVLKKSIIKAKAYKKYLESAINCRDVYTEVINELDKDPKYQKNEDLYGRRIRKNA